MTTSPETSSFAWPGTVLGTVVTLGLLDQQVLTPLIAALADGLEVGVADVGFAVSTYSFAAALAALVIGPLSDARGRRPYLLLAAGLLAASAALIALSPHYGLFVVARLAAGFAGGTISALAIAWVADLVPYRRRGRILAILMGGAMGAAVVAQVGAAFAAAAYGHRIVYVAIAVFAGLAALMLLGLRESGQAARSPRSLQRQMAGHLEFLRSRQHRTAAFAAFCMSGSLVGVSTYAAGWLQETRGFSLEQVGLLYGVFGAAIIGVQPLAGPLSDRLGKRSFTILVSVAVGALTIVLPMLAGPVLVAGLVVFGCLGVARIAAFAALRTELVPADRRAAFMGFSNVFSQLGIAAGAGAGGLLYVQGFASVCWAMAVLGGLAALLVARISEPEPA